jgi:hypothetical protein
MANIDAQALQARQADNDLAHEVGCGHDYLWGSSPRAQLVDIAILATLAAMVSLVLALHH